nr:hypothetical protein [uncultured Flavobacterium sp.]
MMTRKNFTIIFLLSVLVFVCIVLSPVVTKNAKDISYSDFQLAIGPLLSALAVFISYRTEKKKQLK